jgi:uncharacterized protein with PQ loop repeat
MRLLDKVIYAVALISPLALLPQASQVFLKHDTAGLAISTWFMLGAINSLWVVYGIAHKDKPIIIANFLLATLDFAIVFGILKYS